MASTLHLIPLLKRLNENSVEYVVVGGVAAIAHGSARLTLDVDICAPLSEANLSRILAALRDVHPRFRMRPDKMPVPDDLNRLRGIKNLYLETDLGQIDVLGEAMGGVGPFEDITRQSIVMDLGGVSCRVLDLDALIAAKRAAARQKDFAAVAELEVIRQSRKHMPP